MTDELTNYAKDLAAQNAPWSKGVRWWVVLIQAIILLGLGLFILFAPGVANKTVVQLLGVFMLVSGLMDAYQGLRGRVTPRALPYHMFGAGVATFAGLIVVFDMWQDIVSVPALAVVVSLGLIFFGVIGLIIWLMGGTRGNRSFLDLILPLGALLLGGVALWSRLEMGATVVRWLGIIATIVGALLLVETFVLYGKQQNQEATAAQISKGIDEVSKQIEDAGADVQEAARDTTEEIESKLD